MAGTTWVRAGFRSHANTSIFVKAGLSSSQPNLDVLCEFFMFCPPSLAVRQIPNLLRYSSIQDKRDLQINAIQGDFALLDHDLLLLHPG